MIAYDKAELLRPGTRVRVRSNAAPYSGQAGTVVPINIKGRRAWSATNPGTRMTYVEIDGSGRVFGFFTNNLERIEDMLHTKNLIGPKPEPVQTPKFVAPFKSDGRSVVDAKDRVVFRVVSGGHLNGSFSQDLPMSEAYDLAKIVAEALTEKFATKVKDAPSPF